MQPNGLTDRKREKKVCLWIMGVTGFFLVSFFLVPAINDPGAIPELSGRANAMDYATIDGYGSWGNQQTGENNGVGHNQTQPFAWSQLDIYSAFIYGFGDVNCHNKAERSWFINDNQMPVCTRDVGIFAGAFLGAFLFYRRGYNRWTIRDSFLSVMPDKWLIPIYQRNLRMKVMLLVGGLTIVPIALDGGIQMLTGYESTNLRRLLTGSPFGAFAMWFFAASLSSRPVLFDFDATRVRLPANARLAIEEEE